MNKKILLFGGSGLVGSCLKSILPQDRLLVTYRNKDSIKSNKDIFFSIESLDQVQKDVKALVEKVRPDVIINPLAMTNVDQCQLDPDKAKLINTHFPETLVNAMSSDIHLYHVSTDFVFSGNASQVYKEEDATSPCNVYGSTKLEAERILLKSGKASILRTALVYGNDRQKENYLPKFLKKIKQGDSVPLVFNHQRTPTYAPDLAQWIAELIESELYPRILHLAGSVGYTFENFIREACDLLEIDHTKAIGVHSSTFSSAAVRPEQTLLSDEYRKRLLSHPDTPLDVSLKQVDIR